RPRTTRRTFLQSTAAVAAGLAVLRGAHTQGASSTAARKRNLKLGLDNFSVRALGWKADQLIEYAASLQTDSLFITDFTAFEKLDDDYLGGLRKKADDNGLQIHLGSWSICPTSKAFKKDWGSAEEHLRLGIRMAKTLGSPVFRAVLGTGEDRLSPGGIEA